MSESNRVRVVRLLAVILNAVERSEDGYAVKLLEEAIGLLRPVEDGERRTEQMLSERGAWELGD